MRLGNFSDERWEVEGWRAGKGIGRWVIDEGGR